MKCERCELSIDNCTKCSNKLFRRNNPPYCDCEKGYYSNDESGDCIKCSFNCLECD